MSRGFIRPNSRGTLQLHPSCPCHDDDDDDEDTTTIMTKTIAKSSSNNPAGVRNHFSNASYSGATSDIQVQNVKSTRVYIFGQGDVDEEDDYVDGMEMSELRSRGATATGSGGKRNSQNNNRAQRENDDIEVLEKEIVDGETLQSIALQYGCQVSELKRINKLIRDQEFFALKVIKVPIRRHGFLSELIEKENQTSKNGPKLSLRPTNDSIVTVDDVNYDEFDDDDSESQGLLVRTLSIRDVCSSPSRDAQDFLRTMDHDLEKIRKSTNSYKDSLEEVAKTLTCKRIYPIKKKSVSLWNGADCGLHWRTVVFIIVAVVFIAPLTYFLYYEFGKPD